MSGRFFGVFRRAIIRWYRASLAAAVFGTLVGGLSFSGCTDRAAVDIVKADDAYGVGEAGYQVVVPYEQWRVSWNEPPPEIFAQWGEAIRPVERARRQPLFRGVHALDRHAGTAQERRR